MSDLTADRLDESARLVAPLAERLTEQEREDWQEVFGDPRNAQGGQAGTDALRRLRAALFPVEHRMIPGSQERPDGAECACGASWDRWNDAYTGSPASHAGGGEG